MKRISILLSFLVTSASALFAQNLSVKGSVIDFDSAEPMGSASVQIFQISGLVILCVALLFAALIAGRRLITAMCYRRGTPEQKLIMDVEVIRKLLLRNASRDFIDRGLLSDYACLAPDDLRSDLQCVFDTYYRVIYGGGNNPGVSEQENELAREVRERLSHAVSVNRIR